MVRPPSFLDESSSTDETSQSGEFTISQSPAPTITTNRNSFVEQYLNIYYKKTLNESLISTTQQLIEDILGLYENMNDEASNSDVFSFLLLRVGCQAQTYDFEQFIDLTRDEKDQIIKTVHSSLCRFVLKFSYF